MSEELFSYRMRRFREQRNLLQEDLAAALGVTSRYIGMIERGQKEVEPNSSLYKLFALMEANIIPVRPAEGVRERVDDLRVREDPPSYHPAPTGLSVRDALDQVKSDLEALERGTMLEKKRTMTFLREVHLPILARALKLE